MADELKAWIGVCDWDVTATTETWVRQKQDCQLNVLGYRCYGQDRGQDERGGGVILLLKENIMAVV